MGSVIKLQPLKVHRSDLKQAEIDILGFFFEGEKLHEQVAQQAGPCLGFYDETGTDGKRKAHYVFTFPAAHWRTLPLKPGELEPTKTYAFPFTGQTSLKEETYYKRKTYSCAYLDVTFCETSGKEVIVRPASKTWSRGNRRARIFREQALE